eukprot:TRINITY_DN5364_c0_g1_i3.p1 TRINITY_DN5364_c0_g1~~TRINITY_DN5364_c0_g1_i3.p1  ORF type:complete len:166 (+),score=25.11 TRINITY_DN5364_c0_g1_i3:160-657(+)
MGCGSSTDSQPEERTFAVTILNEKEEVQGKGELTVTSEAMTLLSQGESERAVWELRYLRRFGFDKKYFSFEAGRRCTDGPGIWAVSTPKAEQLFQMVDYYINKVKAKPEAASTGTAAQGVRLKRRTDVSMDAPLCLASRPCWLLWRQQEEEASLCTAGLVQQGGV